MHRLTDRNKLSYFMNIAFGLSLLMITLQFQFGETTIMIDEPPMKIVLEHGYITEDNLVIRIVEGIISLGLVALGIERVYNTRRKTRKQNELYNSFR